MNEEHTVSFPKLRYPSSINNKNGGMHHGNNNT